MMVLAGLTFGEIISDAGLVIAIGLIVVFSVLVLLTLVFKIFGKVMSRDEEPITMAAPAAKAAPVAAAPAVVGNTQPVTTTPAVQNGIPAETVAVISAAVAAVAPAGTQYAVSGIRKK